MVNNFVDVDEDLQAKYWELALEFRSMDRINIAECSFDSSPKLYDGLLERSSEEFDIRKERAYEIEKEMNKLGDKKGHASSEDLPEHLKYDLVSMDAEGHSVLGCDRSEKIAINYYELYPPLVKYGVKIPKHIKEIYAESRWCYVFQCYSAAAALSRAIMELAIKDKLGYDKESSIGSSAKYLDALYGKKIISRPVHSIGKDVILEANKVMHSGKMVGKKQTLKVVEKTKEFLEAIYEPD